MLSFTLLFFWFFIVLFGLNAWFSMVLIVRGSPYQTVRAQQVNTFWLLIAASWFYLLNHIVTKGL